MGHAIIYCAACGGRILERDISRGSVLVAEGHHYCPQCASQAPEGAEPMAVIASETPTELRRPATRRGPLPSAPPTRRHAPPRSGSLAPLIGGGVAGVAAIILIVWFLLPGPAAPAPSTSTRTTKPPTNANISSTKPDQFKVADETYAALAAFRDASRDNPQALLDRVQLDLPKLVGTPYETDARMILKEAERALETRRAETLVDQYLQRARDAQSKDPTFRDRTGVLAIYREAREAAEKHSATLALRVRDAEREYSNAFDHATRQAAEPLMIEAARLSSESRYEEALAVLDRFPSHFRDTTEGRRVEDERRRLQEEKRRADDEKAVRETLAWQFQEASRIIMTETEQAYRESMELYLKVFEGLKDENRVARERLTSGQIARIYVTGHYNIACYWSRYRKDVDKTLEHLEQSLKNGWRDWKHIDQDKDLDNVRKDPKFKALIEKYKGS